MAREEERRRKEAEAAKARLESEQKKQGNEITQMFDRLKSENEQASQCETCLCFNPILKPNFKCKLRALWSKQNREVRTPSLFPALRTLTRRASALSKCSLEPLGCQQVGSIYLTLPMPETLARVVDGRLS